MTSAPEPDSAPRLKVVFVIGTLDIGGAEGQLAGLALGLDRRRFVPIVFALSRLGPFAAPLLEAGIRVESFGFRALRRNHSLATGLRLALRNFFRLYRAIRAERPDILHGFLLHAYVFGTLCARVSRVPTVVASRRSLFEVGVRSPLLRLAETITNRWTDLFIANSEAVRRDAIAHEKLPPRKVIVIHNGLDLARFAEPALAGLRARLGLTTDAHVVGVVARLIGYKGHRFFLEAWTEVLRQQPRAVALLVGDGPDRQELEQLAARLDLGASVRFLGSRQDVPALLSVIDLLVHPSLEEGFCNAIVEAMAAGKPVVATAVGGNSEAIVDGVTGLLVPAGETGPLAVAVRSLLAQPARARAMGEAGRRRAFELFGAEQAIQRYQQVYEELAARR